MSNLHGPTDHGSLASSPNEEHHHNMSPDGKGWTQEVAVWADPTYWTDPNHPAKLWAAKGNDLHDYKKGEQ